MSPAETSVRGRRSRAVRLTQAVLGVLPAVLVILAGNYLICWSGVALVAIGMGASYADAARISHMVNGSLAVLTLTCLIPASLIGWFWIGRSMVGMMVIGAVCDAAYFGARAASWLASNATREEYPLQLTVTAIDAAPAILFGVGAGALVGALFRTMLSLSLSPLRATVRLDASASWTSAPSALALRPRRSRRNFGLTSQIQRRSMQGCPECQRRKP